MDSLEYLKQLDKIQRRIKRAKRKVWELTHDTYSMGSMGGMRVQTSRNIHSLEDRIIRLETAKEELQELMSLYAIKKHEIIGSIQSLEDSKDIEILYLHYVEQITLDEISKRLDYCRTHLSKLHGIALENFKKLYERG